MSKTPRRTFLQQSSLALSGGALAVSAGLPLEANSPTKRTPPPPPVPESIATPTIDFRYAPLTTQSTLCLPDDPYKNLIGENGEIRLNHPAGSWGVADFGEIVKFSLGGMESGKVVEQRLEAPGTAIIKTRLAWPEAFLDLTAFATHLTGEGRVDNVLMTITPRTHQSLRVAPTIHVLSRRTLKTSREGNLTTLRMEPAAAPLFAMIGYALSQEGIGVQVTEELGHGIRIWLPPLITSTEKPLQVLIRFPLENQPLTQLSASCEHPDLLLKESHQFWMNWKPFGGSLEWKSGGIHDRFLVACARNIQQAREVKEGKITFQVGPTVYRGLWIVDGHFILEAARYLGYDQEAQEGLEATWGRQQPDGSLIAGGGQEHWKDTGIAMFTLVRQAELAQDWSYFRKMVPQIQRAFEFLKASRNKARGEANANGRYGLLSQGFGDGGLGGIRSEFTNTIWALAGLRATAEAASRLEISELKEIKIFHEELHRALISAARQEMRRHPQGFEYLPMLMKEDPQWNAANEWERPRPQNAQWALSHSVYPGLVFEQTDPVVKGHIQLMQSCTVEDVPIETGWIPHEGLWTYNAPFVAHVYLWAGLQDWARRTFSGFLNHASPLYCWREEQPLRGSLIGNYIGDMPHNWASAECVLFLRHMLALEDGTALRLLEGIGAPEIKQEKQWILKESPTRFGRISLKLGPESAEQYRLDFLRGQGPQPARIEIPAQMGTQFRFESGTGAKFNLQGSKLHVSPEGSSWSATWKAV
jgi:hypothetical protein